MNLRPTSAPANGTPLTELPSARVERDFGTLGATWIDDELAKAARLGTPARRIAPEALESLGDRLDPDRVARLRRLWFAAACAAAVVLALVLG